MHSEFRSWRRRTRNRFCARSRCTRYQHCRACTANPVSQSTFAAMRSLSRTKRGILQELKARTVNVSEDARLVNFDVAPVARLGDESFHESDDDIEAPEDICSVLRGATDLSTALNVGDLIHTLVKDENGRGRCRVRLPKLCPIGHGLKGRWSSLPHT